MVPSCARKQDTYFCHTEKTEIPFPNMEGGVSISSHKEIRCYKHAHRVINARNSRCPAIMINEDHNYLNTVMNEGSYPGYNEPKSLLCIQPFHSSVWSRLKYPMSLSARLTVANPMARLARHKDPKIHGSNCFCSFSQNPVLSAIYIKAIALLMITGARVCCPARTVDSLPWPGF
jgi:hypothetical protein